MKRKRRKNRAKTYANGVHTYRRARIIPENKQELFLNSAIPLTITFCTFISLNAKIVFSRACFLKKDFM